MLRHAITLGSVGDRAKDCTRQAAPATASRAIAFSRAIIAESRRSRVVIEPQVNKKLLNLRWRC